MPKKAETPNDESLTIRLSLHLIEMLDILRRAQAKSEPYGELAAPSPITMHDCGTSMNRMLG
jgi:hypothetical protein